MKPAEHEIADALLMVFAEEPGADIVDGQVRLKAPIDLARFAERLTQRTGLIGYLFAEILTDEEAQARYGAKVRH